MAGWTTQQLGIKLLRHDDYVHVGNQNGTHSPRLRTAATLKTGVAETSTATKKTDVNDGYKSSLNAPPQVFRSSSQPTINSLSAFDVKEWETTTTSAIAFLQHFLK